MELSFGLQKVSIGYEEGWFVPEDRWQSRISTRPTRY